MTDGKIILNNNEEIKINDIQYKFIGTVDKETGIHSGKLININNPSDVYVNGTFTVTQERGVILDGDNCSLNYKQGDDIYTYKGTFKNECFTKGKMYLNDRIILDGTFIDGKLEGDNCTGYLTIDGEQYVYNGIFKNGNLTNGTIKINNKIHKKGSFTIIENSLLVLNGEGCIYTYKDNGETEYIRHEGEFENDHLKNGTVYIEGKKFQEGDFKYNTDKKALELYGNNCKEYYSEDENIIIFDGKITKQNELDGTYYIINNLNNKEEKTTYNNFLHYNISIQHFTNDFSKDGNDTKKDSITGYLRSKTMPKEETINNNNKIYTLQIDKNNSNKRTLTFYGKVIGLEKDITINIDEHSIATLQGEPLTENTINKIKEFFKNIPQEQLDGFDPHLAMLYYTIIMDKNKYQNTNILFPNRFKYIYKKDEEVTQTIDLINNIPEAKRNGRYIIPCGLLVPEHQVNLRVDFDTQTFEIIDTGNFFNSQDHKNQLDKIVSDLEQNLKNKFNKQNWKVQKNNDISQSTGNCVIASNMVATEIEILAKKAQELKDKNKKFEKVDQKFMRNLYENNFGEKIEVQKQETQENKEIKEQKPQQTPPPQPDPQQQTNPQSNILPLPLRDTQGNYINSKTTPKTTTQKDTMGDIPQQIENIEYNKNSKQTNNIKNYNIDDDISDDNTSIDTNTKTTKHQSKTHKKYDNTQNKSSPSTSSSMNMPPQVIMMLFLFMMRGKVNNNYTSMLPLLLMCNNLTFASNSFSNQNKQRSR